MAVAQPQILLAMDGASGSTVTNYGTVASNGTVGQGVENTDWAWHLGAGPFLGYWESLDKDGADQAWISLTGIAMPTTLDHQWLAAGINITGWDTRASSRGYIYGSGSGPEIDGDCGLRIVAPSAGGNFDLECRGASSGGDVLHTFTGLSFGVDYRVVIAIDMTTPSAGFVKFKLDSASVVNSSTSNWTGFTYNNAAGYIGRGNGFSNYYGFTGNVYYLARGHGVLLSNTDMADINSDPSNITGWPGGGAPAGRAFLMGGKLVGGRVLLRT